MSFKVLKRRLLVANAVTIGIIAYAGILDVEAADLAPITHACEALIEEDFTAIENAVTQITDAHMVAASSDLPAHCLVQGYVAPNVGVLLHLPLVSEWNGNFLEASEGGYGGSLVGESLPWCHEALRRGYACTTHNTGHTGWLVKASWAYNNLQAEFDYGIRGHYVAALAGKAITEYFYKSAPKYSYHVGCSGGGKQGMVEAQRYPWTFDGILALEPSSVTATGVVIHWNALVTNDSDGNPLFTDDDLDVLHQGAIAACDANDGLEDGIIGGDPRTCDFDPGDLVCSADQDAGCLTPQQVEAARKVYEGPVTSSGEKLSRYFPWYPSLPGSEKGGFFTRSLDYKTEWWRFMGFTPDPGPGWQASDFDFDHDFKRMGAMDAIVNGYSNPDLRNFKAAGGKLMVIQGWEDSGLPGPQVSIDYYEMAERIIGGREATQDFYRLFMVPGRSHCDEGIGAANGDYLTYLEEWVEKEQAPDMIVGYHAEPMPWAQVNYEVPEKYDFSRPHFPYPLWAKYRGKGDPNDYRSFEAVEPEP